MLETLEIFVETALFVEDTHCCCGGGFWGVPCAKLRCLEFYGLVLGQGWTTRR